MFKILSAKAWVIYLGKEIKEPDGHGMGEAVVDFRGNKFTVPFFIWHRESLTGAPITEPSFVVWVKTGQGDESVIESMEAADAEADDEEYFDYNELEDELKALPIVQKVLRSLVSDFNPTRKANLYTY